MINKRFFLESITLSKIKNLFFYTILIIVIILPSSFYLTESFQIHTLKNPFYPYLYSYDNMYAFPLNIVLLSYISFFFIKKKIILQSQFLYPLLTFIYLIIYMIYGYHFEKLLDTRIIKNILIITIFFFTLIFFLNLEMNNKFLIYKIYSLILTIICIINILNIKFYYNIASDNAYFTPIGYLSGLFNLIIFHYQDYFPCIIFLSFALDFFFLKKKLILIYLFFLIKTFWIFNYYHYGLLFGEGLLNKSLLIMIFFFFVINFIVIQKFIKLDKIKIMVLIILLNVFYILVLLLFYNFLDSSLQDRSEVITFLFYQLDITNIFFPLFVKTGFLHNLHNDFWDLYFTFGLLFIIFYKRLIEELYNVYLLNKQSFVILFCFCAIGSLVQNNIFNIYSVINLTFVISLMNNKKKLQF